MFIFVVSPNVLLILSLKHYRYCPFIVGFALSVESMHPFNRLYELLKPTYARLIAHQLTNSSAHALTAASGTSIIPSLTITALPPTRTAVTSPSTLSTSSSMMLGRLISYPCSTM